MYMPKKKTTSDLISRKQRHGFAVSPLADCKVELGAHGAIIFWFCRGSRRDRTRTELDAVMKAHRNDQSDLGSLQT